MSSWEKDLEELLAALGVQQEQTNAYQKPPEHEAEFFFTESSQQHQGVFYRGDLVGAIPELRVYVPAKETMLKVQVYLVHISPKSVLSHLFALYMNSEEGSDAFHKIEGSTTFHFLRVMTETMKGLFWQGDLYTLRFPPEIDVQRLTCS
ncbi:hypothetical protein KSF_107160 [Reticulibacter mediterranei]|uniref:Uncharacterized protein n=1 Tax=Reticulibacter mediterranei TaxID=2778369 RepID=A0A8J3IU67_9CHLR|nr:hypothetical protein [Reticulibacter mediterranei]GHP00669.1 hypothetical protein KSF_107160 [Reticulibacter mediterranei]